ncbi:MAG TPA: hypothetical protein VLY63_01520 [Anaerolineae bacterium]|nr:hypothetical protein [Anaerolineae bacterium]
MALYHRSRRLKEEPCGALQGLEEQETTGVPVVYGLDREQKVRRTYSLEL